MADISGDIAIVSNYIAQGLTSSDNKPGVQGNLLESLPKNFYVNLWGASVEFLAPDGSMARQEFEFIAGNQGTLNQNWGYNFWVGQYYYPGATASNYGEVNLSLTYKYFTLMTDYSNDFYATLSLYL